MHTLNYRIILAAILFFGILSCHQENDRIEDIISRMSLTEKIEFIGGYKSFNIRSLPEYGIPEIHLADGPVGVRNFGASTAYPASIALAASWDKELAAQIGAAIGMEARSKNAHIMLGPAMNIHRAPFCGRNFEYLGEDPYLAGEIASQYVIGMQEQGIVATAKHYVANYQDFDRHTVSSDMDIRTLHEIYLPAFKACVQKANVGAVMTSYNLINGIHASEHNYLNNEILKNDWGFEGIIMSDWTSTYNGIACAQGGLDLEMPAGTFMHPDTLIPAIESGLLSEDVIDDKVRRILKLYERFGYFDNPDISESYVLDEDFVRSTSLNAARGGVTLLKNENNILPLTKSEVLKVAVIGINADPAITGGGGSSYTDPLYPVSLLDAIKKIGGESLELVYEPALYIEAELPPGFFAENNFYTYIDGKEISGVSAEFFDNVDLEGDPVYTDTYSSLNLTLHDSTIAGLPEVNYSARFKAFFEVEKTGEYNIAVAGDDGYRVFINGEKVIEHWQNQPETVRTATLLLKEGFENKVIVEYYQGGGSASIRLAYKPEMDKKRRTQELWKGAVKAVKNSDLVIFSAGFNKNTETEGIDRIWDLPYGQDEMIKKLTAYNENSIVVLNAGGNVSMPWLDDVKGLIYAWYPGQEGNLAVAEIIFGLTNPSGKLPVSFENKLEDNPTYLSYHDEDGDKRVYFSEGIFMGYRHYDKSDIKSRFPFGFGLSYTTFEYSDIQVSKKKFSSREQIEVSFKIKNTGEREGAEIAQIYIRDIESTLPRPIKELKGFEKITLKQGEEKTITLKIDQQAFSYYNEAEGGWISEPGKFEILIGSSSEDIKLHTDLELIN